MNLFLPRLAAIAFLALASPVVAASAQPEPNAASAPILPDPKLTPGDVLEVSLADIQEHGYSAKVRNVPVSVKREVYASYGIAHWSRGEYEIDHLVSLSLGGSNSKKNLWPQSYLTEPWNAHTKDQLEYKLLSLVRAGKVDLRTAQQEMARDWIAAYKKHVSPEPLADKRRAGKPARSTGLAVGDESARRDEDPDTETASSDVATASAQTSAASAAAGQVWVEHEERGHLEAGQRLLRQNEGGQVHERGRCARRWLPQRQVTEGTSCHALQSEAHQDYCRAHHQRHEPGGRLAHHHL